VEFTGVVVITGTAVITAVIEDIAAVIEDIVKNLFTFPAVVI
jgi:hypothetical protein